MGTQKRPVELALELEEVMLGRMLPDDEDLARRMRRKAAQVKTTSPMWTESFEMMVHKIC